MTIKGRQMQKPTETWEETQKRVNDLSKRKPARFLLPPTTDTANIGVLGVPVTGTSNVAQCSHSHLGF